MPRVDFYVLEGTDDRARLTYACRLIEKAYLQDLTVYVRLASPADANAFDTLLWTFSDRSFVPHGVIDAEADTPAPPPGTPVWIGTDAAPAASLLVNLSPELPTALAQYERIAEFVDADPTRRDAGRRRFAASREAGLTPDTHRISP
jgi:DNA polymerase-3 subunit chi